MATHDRYDIDILKVLQRIATSLDKIEKKTPDMSFNMLDSFDCEEIHSPSEECTKIYDEYNEKDTMCDLCKHECKEDCYLIDITTRDDTRRHFINGIGFICPLRRKE